MDWLALGVWRYREFFGLNHTRTWMWYWYVVQPTALCRYRFRLRMDHFHARTAKPWREITSFLSARLAFDLAFRTLASRFFSDCNGCQKHKQSTEYIYIKTGF